MALIGPADPWRPRTFGELGLLALPTLGGSALFLMAVFGVFAYFVGLSVKVAVAWVVLGVFFPLTFVVTLYHITRMAISDVDTAFAHTPNLPRVLRSLIDPNTTEGLLLLLLLLVEPSHFLGQGTAVSIYSVMDEFEILIGEGFVQNVQQDRKVQVCVSKRINGGKDSTWVDIVTNSSEALKRTLVRPGNQAERED